MTIQAQLPDGTTLQFPEGTPDAVVNGAVKQHINQQPSDASQTPESMLGLKPAPSEEKPATTDLSGGYVSPEGAYVPPQAIPDTKPSPTAQPVAPPILIPSTMQPAQPAPTTDFWAPGGREMVENWAPGGLQVGKNLLAPAGDLLGLGIGAFSTLGPAFSGAQKIVANTLSPILGDRSARDIAALPEAFPFGFHEVPPVGPEAPPSPKFFSERTAPPRDPGMSNADRIQQLVEHSVNEEQPVVGPPVARGPLTEQSPLAPQVGPDGSLVPPGTAHAPNLPPVPDGSVRLYHGGSDPTSGGARWVTPDYVYARDYRPGQPVSYVDVPRDHPAVQAAIASHPDEPMRLANFNAPEDIAARLQPVAQPSGGAQSPSPGPTSTVPLTASPDPAIMTQAEMQAHARGFFSPADQAAATNAMLPDANATAVRKLFSDTVPSDPERARITASQPAIQAANNVDATGPMSYATAMDIDRDLTSRMRGASGSDAHDLSQLQQSLRTQMDQVPDLDNLRPGRLAWMQSIKQGQMEDINYGASLKNDPAAADAYVRQRAAALLKNDNAMRNWTPEETAALEQVAKSGDIGMLGRLSVSLIKPITRVALGAVGHSIAGPMGAIVGSEIGGDVGATQAGKLRAYLSKTTLDPVMQQITRGVPPASPPNRLGPSP